MEWGNENSISDFLTSFEPSGPWYLVSIGPRGLDGQRFTVAAEAEAWAHERNAAGCNLYFHCNQPFRKPRHGKAKKSDISSAHWLFVDCDPAKGADVESERDRIYRGLTVEFPAGVPEPTAIIDSGGGYWAFWRLKRNIKPAEAERLGKGLEAAFSSIGADHCHNVDRIARLPGTINYPDKKKRAAGRSEAQAALLLANWSRRYDSDQFEALAESAAEAEAESGRKPAARKDDGEAEPVEQVTGIEALSPWKVPGWLRTIVQDGRGSKPKAGDDSRSAWLFDCAQGLVRCGVPDQVIRGVLLSDKFGISESVLEHPKPRYYAARQVARAHEALAGSEPRSKGRPEKPTRGMDKGEGSQQAATGAADSGGKPEKTALAAGWDDDSLALRFGCEALKGCGRWVGDFGKWMIWDGNKWSPDDRLAMHSLVRKFQRGTLAEQCGPKIRNRVLSAGTTAMIESLTRSNPGVAASAGDWDVRPWLLNTPGATVDLVTGATRKPDRDDMLTMTTAVQVADRGQDCPVWRRCLRDWFPDQPEVPEFLQRLAGYALTGSTKEHKLFFMFGTGRNGKSVFLDTLTEIMGDYAKVSPASTWLSSGVEQHPADLAMLRGARLVQANELPAGKAWNEARIKSMTGGDPITARFMRQDFFTFQPQFTLLVAGNHQPSFAAVDAAIIARVVLIHFRQRFDEGAGRDNDLPAKLRAEWPAILRWAVEGAVQWQAQGLMVPESVKADSMEYLEAQDEFADFVDECLILDHEATIKAADLYREFRDWSQQRGHGTPWTHRGLLRVMRERGFKLAKAASGQVLRGYRLGVDSRHHEPVGGYGPRWNKTW